jgi:hypothetical protein
MPARSVPVGAISTLISSGTPVFGFDPGVDGAPHATRLSTLSVKMARILHRESVPAPAGVRQRRSAMARDTGISNRESAREEEAERAHFPPQETSSPPPEDAAGRVGEQPLEDRRDRHTSHKAGSRSIAQKEAGSKYADHSMPASRKVPGAYGKEPDGPSNRD